MKHAYLLLASLLVIQTNAQAAPISCAILNPKGPVLLIECLARQNGYPDAATFWNTKLFNSAVVNRFCDNPPNNLDTAQQEFFKTACSTPSSNDYFSFANFILADATLKLKLGDDYTFLRSSDYDTNVIELENFLAAVAGKTMDQDISAIQYQNIGLYATFEFSGLGARACFNYPSNPDWTGNPAQRTPGSDCGSKDLENFYPESYPVSTYAVAQGKGPLRLTDTAFVMDGASRYDFTTKAITVTQSGVPTLYPNGTYASPSLTKWVYANTLLSPGNWVEMGALRLSGFSLLSFFAYYNQQILPLSLPFASFSDFAKTYASDGLIQWMGALFKWNISLIGTTAGQTIHSTITNPDPVCKTSALMTSLLNGNCIDASQALLAFNYYASTLTGQVPTGVEYTYDGTTSNSMICSPNLVNYCTAP